MPARLADGLALKWPVIPLPELLRPVLNFEEFGSPASSFRKEAGLGCNGRNQNTSAALCQVSHDLLKKPLPISALKRLILNRLWPEPDFVRVFLAGARDAFCAARRMCHGCHTAKHRGNFAARGLHRGEH